MRFTILEVLLFTFLIAVELRSTANQVWGIIISLALLPLMSFALALAVFSSKSGQGRLLVEQNRTFRILARLLTWCMANLLFLIGVIAYRQMG